MKIFGKNWSFIIVLLAILIVVCEKIEGATTETCVPQYGFLPCTSGIWGTLFLVVVYQYLMSIGQGYIADGSNKFFGLLGPGIFGASLFHIFGNFPTLYIVLESRLSSDDTGAAASAAMGMSVLAGSAVMSLTLVWPSVIVFGSYDLADDNDDDTIITEVPEEEEPSFLAKLTAYGVTTDIETSYTARLLLISMIPFFILQLPKIINSDSVTRVIVIIALIISLSFFFAYIVYQIFQPWIQNRIFDYETQKFVKNKLLNLLSTKGKPNVQLIKDLYKGLDKNHDSKVTSAELKTLLLGIQVQADGQLSDDLVNRIMDQIDVTGDEIILEDEFVKVLKKWLQDARKSLSKNDYNPLSFFVKPVPAADEEQQQSLIPKTTTSTVTVVSSIWDYLEALAMIAVGIVIAVLIARPLIMNVANFATLANVPSFLIPYFVIPCAIGIPRLISTISSASQKTQRAASLTLSQIYSGVFMSNMSSLSTFLLTIYIKDVPWDVSAEVLVVFIICVALGIITSTRTVFPLWTGYVGYLFYPISILMLYLLTVVWGWS
ncbi:sodium/calcium exchanger NCL1-like [Rutidosis leptorrhynchoides]|uniref:sodium/calcium exchanger NCL1-like n=1 Tax=Rutidosis leptorrhynchoides TaxID=125765 RepID=UPI003A9924E8